MRSLLLIACVGLAALWAVSAVAELQNVEVGGKIRIRGNMYDMDKAVNRGDMSFVEERTRLNVKADFTDNVSAFIELDSYDIWGEDFRSPNYVLGADNRSNSADDVEIYQSYIEAKELFGAPLRLRVGRQELTLGSGWLVGTNDKNSFFTGLSFDAILLAYETDQFAVKAFAAKLAESMGDFGEDDADLYGVYASYLGFEDIVLDAYWLFVRDDVAALAAGSDLHTVGLRGAGTVGAFDFEAEAAYQFGDIDGVNLDWDAWGINLLGGYTFDVTYQPRVYAGFAFLEGSDGNNMPFNRLFSNWEYSQFLDFTDLSNALIYRLGLSAMPCECLKLSLDAAYFQADETYPQGPWCWSRNDDDSLGWELGLYADYQYSEDLVFRAGYAHFFAGDGVEDGALAAGNGLFSWQGGDDDDYNYLFLETELSF